MRRSAPPLQSIEAFIVAARSTSFRAAAESLALSPSAFSRRIQTLESFVGASLFERAAPTPTLTIAGGDYHDEIASAIDTIRNATAKLRSGPRRRSCLRVLASQSFAISWLMPRLASFRTLHLGSNIEVVLGRDIANLRDGRADIAIASGPRNFGDQPFERLIELEGVLVSAPVMAGGGEPPRSLADLEGQRRLGVQAPHDLWLRWLAQAGLSVPFTGDQIVFETLTLMYEAAANGLGVALAIPTVADRYLQDGRLRPCLNLRAPLNSDYNIVYADKRLSQRPDVRAFSIWMKKEIQGSRTKFDSHMTSPRLDSAATAAARMS